MASHCARWRTADPTKHGTNRLVCTDLAHHPGEHHNWESGWYWSRFDRDAPPRRDWVCRGWVQELVGICGRTLRATEDEARVKRWKIGTRNGVRDPLCPQCGRPDPETAALLRDLERSVRHG